MNLTDPYNIGFAAGFIVTVAISTGYGIGRRADVYGFIGGVFPVLVVAVIVGFICGLVTSGFADGW
jgi:hypothetical protein